MKRIALIGNDIHAGSSYGILPPNAETKDGPVPQNRWNAYLWECWLDACLKVKEANVDAIINLGDTIDGDQWRNGGTELRSAMKHSQVSWAAQILRELPPVPTYFIHGTPYHDGKNGEWTEVLAERMDNSVHPHGEPLAGEFSFHCLDLEVEGVNLNFLHEIPVGGALYRAVSIDREMVWSALAGKEGKATKADFIARAHAHFFVHIEHASKHGIINPCWQLPTPYMMRKSAYRMLPDIGFTIIEVDGEAKKHGRDPISIEKVLYPLPTVHATKF